MRRLLSAFLLLCLSLLMTGSSKSADDFKLEPGFTLLFNGKNLDGWKEASRKKEALDGKTEAFGGRFKVVDGKLVYDPSVKGDLHIETTKEFGKDVHIKFDFKPGPKCNNDVFFRGTKFDIVPGNKENKNVKEGEWSTFEIVVTGDKIEHKINGATVRTSKAKPGATPLRLRGGIRCPGNQEYPGKGIKLFRQTASNIPPGLVGGPSWLIVRPGSLRRHTYKRTGILRVRRRRLFVLSEGAFQRVRRTGLAMKNRSPFARAWSFLDFKPVAKWVALVAAVGTDLLYIALLIVLALFADLMIHRGHVPSYGDLAVAPRGSLEAEWARLPVEEKKRQLQDWKVDEATLAKLTAESPGNLTPALHEGQWRAFVSYLLARRVSPEAAEVYRERTLAATNEPPYVGVLSLVVQSRDHWLGNRTVSALARWFPWTWQAGEALPYLSWLLGAALVLALVQALLLFTMNYAAAVATVEAATRLRRAIYHHTFRLGTLAFRALGPSEAVGVFTRHVEAVHDMLYAWLTVVIREPVKFGLLLIFALIINFWLALAFLVFALLVWLIGGQVAAYFREKGRVATRASANQLALLQESLMLMRLVKVYLMELFNQTRVERQMTTYSRSLLVRYARRGDLSAACSRSWPCLATRSTALCRRADRA